MNGYLPESYPEELFYSIIARSLSHQATSLSSATRFMFRKKRFSFHTLLARGLNKIIEINRYSVTAEELIKNHTNYFLLAPFAKEKDREKLLRSMLEEDTLMIRFENDFGSTLKNSLSYCPLCSKEDNAYYGEPYWHRIHQLSTVLICPYHFCYLKYHKVKDLERKSEIYPLKLNYCELDNIHYCKDNKLIELTSELYRLLYDEEFRNSINTDYTNRLIEKGFAKGSRVNLEKLTPTFLEYYGEQFLYSELSLPKFTNRAFNWLALLTRSSKYITSPTMHVLLRCFLENMPDDINKSKILRKKEETHLEVEIGFVKPFRCINRAADHFGQNVVDNYEVRNYKFNNTTVEKFSCSCGMVFTRSSLMNNIEKKLARTIVVQQLGEILESAVLKMVNDGCSFHSAAKLFAISPTKVRKLCRIHNVVQNNVRTNKVSKRYIDHKWVVLNQEEESTKQKEIWLKLLADNPFSRILELIVKEPTTYKWLYTYDRKFFQSANKEFSNNKRALQLIIRNHKISELKQFIETYKQNLLEINYGSRVSAGLIKAHIHQHVPLLIEDVTVVEARNLISSLAESEAQYRNRVNQKHFT